MTVGLHPHSQRRSPKNSTSAASAVTLDYASQKEIALGGGVPWLVQVCPRGRRRRRRRRWCPRAPRPARPNFG